MKRISDYPPHFLNFKDDTFGSTSFSDAMCSGVTGLRMDILFTPVGGGVSKLVENRRIGVSS